MELAPQVCIVQVDFDVLVAVVALRAAAALQHPLRIVRVRPAHVKATELLSCLACTRKVRAKGFFFPVQPTCR